MSWPGSLTLARLLEREFLLREERPDISMLIDLLVEYEVELRKLLYFDCPGGS